ncbi:hypothetical protein ACHAWF_008242 [Thalassiosira exigua]
MSSEATPRGVPLHKCVPGTGFVVDGFKAARRGNATVAEFFLTHAHSDHYDGMSPRFDRPFYCSTITANVVCHKFGLDRALVRIIDPGQAAPTIVRGVEVWAVDANHCPGAVQFLFHVPSSGARYVHTGDVRFCPATFRRDPVLASFARRTTALYLDTTYCRPSHAFPPQEEAIEYVAERVARRESQTPERGKALFLLSAYNIGKEKIFLIVARATGKKLYADPRKKALMDLLQMPEISAILTDDPASTNVHLVPWNALGELWPYFRPDYAALREARETYGAEEAVGFVPSGWTYGGGSARVSDDGDGKEGGGGPGKFSVVEKGPDQIHLVPYSEHSSYNELREYVRWIRPERVVPTVGVGKEGETAKMLKHFSGLVDEGACKRRFLQAFGGKKSGGGTKTISEEAEAGADVKKKREEASGVVATLDADHSKGDEKAEEEAREAEEVIVVVEERQHNLPRLEVDDGCNLLMGATGIADCSVAKKLLEKANGNVELAANMFFDSALGRTTDAPRPINKRATPTKSPNKQTLPQKRRGGRTAKKKDGKGSAQKRPGASGQKSLSSFFISTSPVVDRTKSLSTSQSPFRPVNHSHHHQQQQNGQVIDLMDDSDSDEIQTVITTTAAAPTPNSAKAEDQASDGDKPNVFAEKPAALRMEANQKLRIETSPVRPRAEDNKALLRQSQVLSQSSSVAVCKCDKEELSYHPVSDAMWSEGTPCPYLHLASTFELITATKKRLLIRRYLVNMFRSILALSPESTVAAIYLTIGTLGPEHQKLELGIGGSAVAACVSEVAGVSRQALRDAYRREGDMGDAACLFRRAQRTLAPLPILTVSGVSKSLHAIHGEGGGGSVDRKRSLAKTMIRSCRGPETRYIGRTLLQCMRIGANRTSVLQALARAVIYHHHYQKQQPKGGVADETTSPPTEERLQAATQAFEKAYNLSPDIEELVPALISKGLDAVVDSCIIRPGTPLKPMLAKPSTGIDDAVTQMGKEEFICEYKYDGQRCQIHYFDSTTRLWSRNLEEKTRAFPDAVDQFCHALDRDNVSSIVLDAEVVGVERLSDSSSSSYRFLSFQELSTRPRGDDVKTSTSASIPVALLVFDIMLLNDRALVDLPLCDRLSQLEAVLPRRQKGIVEIAQRCVVPPAGKGETGEREAEVTDLGEDGDCDNHRTSQDLRAAATEKALMASLKAGCEGVMLKPLNHNYEPGKRSNSWIKLKKDYVKDMQESDLDLVPIGAWWGNGRKAGWFSPFLLAVFDPVREEYQSVCRVMSGFSDSFYKQSKAFFDQNIIEGPKPAYYNTGEACSVWFHPVAVWEIRGADISVSPVHRAAAGNVHSGRGLALRFPRFIRQRPDKMPEDATTGNQLLELFNKQTVKWTLPVAKMASRNGGTSGSSDEREGYDCAKKEEDG